jgi:hypothetical protein
VVSCGDTPEQREEIHRRHGLDQADVEPPVVHHRMRSNQTAAADEAGVADGKCVERRLGRNRDG